MYIYIYMCVCVRYLKLSHQGIAYACLYAPSNMIPSTVGPRCIHQIKWLYYSDTGVLTSTSRDVFLFLTPHAHSQSQVSYEVKCTDNVNNSYTIP